MHSERQGSAFLDNLASCSRCGLCLDVCPTYHLKRVEPESPRGRVQLMWLAAQGEADPTDIRPHLDSCLRCGKCEPVCPTGVKVVDAVRDHLARHDGASSGSVLLQEARARVQFLSDRVLEILRRL